MTRDLKRLIKAMTAKRESEGLSLRRLADQTGVSFASLSRLERGEVEPDPTTRARVLNWLGPIAAKTGGSSFLLTCSMGMYKTVVDVQSKS